MHANTPILATLRAAQARHAAGDPRTMPKRLQEVIDNKGGPIDY